ncbi:MAG: DUF2442 domain-containing protein [Bacteroidota bacterium]|jgi:hypothetical protein
MKAVSVNALPEYKIQVTFDDGVSGVIDLKDFIGKGIFSELLKTELFNKVYTTGYSIAWSEELEIDMIAIYAEIVNKKPEDILSASLNYATN